MASNAGIGPDALKTPAEGADPAAAFAEAATFGEGLRQARERSGKSMAELAADVQRMAKALGRAGVEPGDRVAFVDVPGHARFIGNMLAGIGSVPAALLVVAAATTARGARVVGGRRVTSPCGGRR